MWLALLPLIAAQSELCPEVTTSKPCSSSQDFVFVVDASFSRLEYHGEFQEFLRRFAGGLDLGDSDGPRMSIVSFDGTTTGLPAADVTTIHVSLSSSAADVADAIDELTVPQEICSDEGGCTCISCGIEMAWDVVIAGDKAGRGGFQPTLIVLTDGFQNVNGGWPAARVATERVKAEGGRLIMLGFGDGELFATCSIAGHSCPTVQRHPPPMLVRASQGSLWSTRPHGEFQEHQSLRPRSPGPRLSRNILRSQRLRHSPSYLAQPPAPPVSVLTWLGPRLLCAHSFHSMKP